MGHLQREGDAADQHHLMAPIERVSLTGIMRKRHIGLDSRCPAPLRPGASKTTDGIGAAVIAEGAQFFENPDQCQPLLGGLARIRRKQPVEQVLPQSDPRHRLMRPLVVDVRLVPPQDLADGIPRDVQLPRDLLHRPALLVKGPSDPRNRVHLRHPLRSLTRSQRSDETSTGQNWAPNHTTPV